VPAPVKPAIHPDRFAHGPFEPPLRPAAERTWLDALERAGVEVLDPAPRLARLARAGRAAYLTRDTHWRPEAMDEVARELALVLRGVAELPSGDTARFAESPLAVEGTGDTATLLGVAGLLGPAPRERVEIRPVTTADGAPYRPARGAPVLLLGDSFSAVFSQPDLGWGAGGGLAERLAFHLGLPVDRILRNAGGASATRRALADELARDPSRLDGVRVVVWQLAAREITQGEWTRIVW
jgi:alginate O-acetyltransferase complex protein AlgJ